jgi:hypothetical protein
MAIPLQKPSQLLQARGQSVNRRDALGAYSNLIFFISCYLLRLKDVNNPGVTHDAPGPYFDAAATYFCKD